MQIDTHINDFIGDITDIDNDVNIHNQILENEPKHNKLLRNCQNFKLMPKIQS